MAQAAPLIPAPADFAMPPILHNEEGRLRTVGVEIEFVGPTAEETARRVSEILGGQVVQVDPHAFRVEGSSLGDVLVELDSRIVHPEKSTGLLGDVIPVLAAWFGSAASYLVPCELVTSPLPIDRLHEVDALLGILRDAGAHGTQDAAVYAFGLHFNPEIPRLEVGTAVATLKAFVLLNAWLRREVVPDPTRAWLGVAAPFPAEYVQRIVAPDYWPDLPAFIDDYLAVNATRNRDLDLLPLLLHFDAERVRAVLPNEKIKARPTFHYRLPDARASDPGWSIAPDWNRWVAVERLAADRDRLESVALTFLAFEGEEKSWADVVERIVLA
jgi:hypothetical protein